jgi:hypothetical protein
MQDLQLDWLRAFVAVVDTGSLTAAAKQIYRSQSAVAVQLRMPSIHHGFVRSHHSFDARLASAQAKALARADLRNGLKPARTSSANSKCPPLSGRL